MVVFTNVKKEDILNLKGEEEEIKSIYETLRKRVDGVLLTLYNSKKLLLQGKKENVEKLIKKLERRGIGKRKQEEFFRNEVGWVIGSDESLKGDTFGGIVVAGVKADSKIRKKLVEIGVADSKRLADREILLMARKIKDITQCEIINLHPEEYNRALSVTKLLNNLHLDVANFLKPGKHIVDLYPGCSVGDIKETKAESKYVEVAAASILARATALEQIQALSLKAGFEIPKGSTHVKEALEKLKNSKLNYKEFVKLHFNNVQEVLFK